MDLYIDLKNYKEDGSLCSRKAARAIIKKDNTYAFIRSDLYGEYKFPGGGIDKGEMNIEALIREVREEAGLIVLEDKIDYIGKIVERKKGRIEDILEMTSYYYQCEVSNEIVEQKLDDYEKLYGYKLVFISLKEALNNNKKIMTMDNRPWIIRDIMVIEKLLDEE